MTTRLLTILTILWGTLLYGQGQKVINITGSMPTLVPSNDIVARDRVSTSGTMRTTGTTGRFYASTNEDMLFDFNYLVSSGPVDFPNSGNALALGNLEGVPSVGSYGNATYTVGLDIPVGTQGIEPALSIVYSGATTSGALGLGFELSGLSAICLNRLPVSYVELNSKIMGTDYGFSLDGQRLNSKTGNYSTNKYGADNTEYDTEIAGFSKIVSHGTGTLPSYFTIATKDGTLIEYGNTPDSKAYPSGGGQYTPIMWKINKITDKNGNYMLFNYGYDEGESYIKSILYTGNVNSGQLPYNTIYFSYEKRNDVNTQYYASSFQSSSANKLVQKRLLTKITAYAKGDLFRRYDMAYKFDGINSKLVGIQESTDTEKRSPVYFNWDLTGNFSQSYTPSRFVGNSILQQGDFNGNGVIDYMSMHSFTNISIHENSSVLAALTLPTPCFEAFITDVGTDVPGTSGVRFRFRNDVNGDYANDTYEDYKLIMNSEGNYELKKTGSVMSRPGAHVNTKAYMINIDKSPASEFIIFDQNNNLVSPYPFSGKLNLNHQGKIYPVDINGDNKTELLSINGSDFKIYRYNETTNVFDIIQQGSGWFGNDPGIKIIDQNGDGNSDILFVPSNPVNNYAYVCMSDGYTLQAPVKISDDLFTDKMFDVGDFNGDGKSDILNTRLGGQRPIYLSNGIGYVKQMCNIDVPISYGTSIVAPVADYNNDGFSDIVANGYIFTGDPQLLVKNMFLNQIVDNKTYNFVYELANSPSFPNAVYQTTKTTIPYFIKYLSGLPIYLVSKITDNTGRETNYRYYDYAYNINKERPLGFSKVVVSCANDNSYNVTENEYHNTIGTFYPKTQKQYTFDQSLLLSLSDDTLDYVYIANDYYRLNKSTSVSQNFIAKVKEKTVYDFDNNGNTLNTLVTKYNENTLEYTSSTATSYINVNSWAANYPSLETAVSTYKAEPNHTRVLQYSYDGKGNIVQSVSDPSSTAPVTTTLSDFSASGVAGTTTVSAPNVEVKVSKVFYDPTGRFITKTVNELNQEAKTEYDNFGNPLKHTNISGKITTYKYSSFGELLEKVDERGIKVTYSEGLQPSTGFRYQTTECPSTPKQTKYYNVDNLLMREEFNGYNGLVAVDYEYDPLNNNLKRKTKPYYAGVDSPIWIEFTYDNLNRAKTRKIGTSTHTYNYDGLSVSVVDPVGRITTQLHDCLGNVVESTQPGNVKVTLKYNSAGNLIQSGTGGSIVENKYDLWGNRTEMKDPDAGTITSIYDAYGRLVTNQTPRNSTTYVYDVLNRVLYETDQESSTSYTYISTGNGINNVASIQHSNGSVESYEYNEYGELIKNIKTIDGQNLAFEYQNDSYGNLINVKYPSGFSITRKYSIDGFLNEVVRDDNGQSIWKMLNTTANGSITQTQLGQYNSETKEYDPVYDYIKNIKTKKGAASIYEQAFNFNSKTGNLTSRSNPLRGLAELFTYDDLDRLRTGSINGVESFNMTYYDNGNIDHSSGIGTYKYDNIKVHAVRAVNFPEGGISTQLQDITYNKFDKVATITEGTSLYTLTYGVDQQRCKSVLKRNSVVYKTTTYFDLYEKETIGNAIKEYHYIETGEGLAAVYIKYPNAPASNQMYYMATDYLGSILALVNEAGNVAEEMYYDPWGKRRNPNNWSSTLSSLPSLLPRGYTGHEHLDDFKLIDMNGRVFDPILARFLSPDNYIQDPLNSQNYNRYTYGLNNPLRYNDPDGQWIHLAIGAGIGAIVNVASNWKNIKATYHKEGLFSAVVKGTIFATTGAVVGLVSAATFGAAVGVLGTGAGAIISAGAISGAVGSGLTHIYNAPLNGYSPTKGLGRAMLTGALYGAAFGAVGHYGGKLLGRVFEKLGDRAAANGKYTQAIKYYRRAETVTPKPAEKPIWKRKSNPSEIKSRMPAKQSNSNETGFRRNYTVKNPDYDRYLQWLDEYYDANGIKSFDDFTNHPKLLWGKSKDEIAGILGDGWTEGVYGSNKQGWKFMKGDKMVFYNQSSSQHGGAEYWGVTSGKVGILKVVDISSYLHRWNDGATIFDKNTGSVLFK